MTTALPTPSAPMRARSNSTFAIALRRLRKHRAAMVSLVVIGLLILVAIFAPLIAPRSWPNTRTLPRWAFKTPAIKPNNVVLPQPLGP